MKTIGRSIAEARKAAKMTQRELSWESGYSIGSIAGWENDRHVPSRRAIKALEEALGATLAPDQGERRVG